MAGAMLIVKECLGFVGTLAIALPWARDFSRRWQKRSLEGKRGRGRIGELVAWLQSQDESWLQKPKPFDLMCMAVGLGLLSGSFLLGILSILWT